VKYFLLKLVCVAIRAFIIKAFTGCGGRIVEEPEMVATPIPLLFRENAQSCRVTALIVTNSFIAIIMKYLFT